MIDPITLSVAIGAVVVSILTHLKFSKCMGFEISTRTPKTSVPDSPIHNNNESAALLQHSEPINIPKHNKK